MPICVIVGFNDAAAISVFAAGAAGAAGAADTPVLEAAALALDDGAADEPDAAAEAAGLGLEDAVVLPELQLTTRAATPSAARAATTPRKRGAERGRLTRNLQEFRLSPWSP